MHKDSPCGVEETVNTFHTLPPSTKFLYLQPQISSEWQNVQITNG